LSFLKNHPFPVEAYFESSVVLTFAIPKENLTHLIPECLQPDLFQDKWAFIAVAMVQTKGLRPKGFPKMLGNDFFLTGYRIFVRYKTSAGKNLRGLYILKSETNKKKMELLGNVFTHYNYSTTDIQIENKGEETEIKSIQSGFQLRYNDTIDNVGLPLNSPFSEWKVARRYAGPLPFTFTYKPKQQQVLIIEGVRQNWKPNPIKVIQYKLPFIEQLNLSDVTLANAFIIKNIPYYWKKARIDQWQQ